MARSIRSSNLETRTARLKLPIATKPVYIKIAPGIGLGYRRNQSGGVWVVRRSDGKRGNSIKAIGRADDYAEADGADVLDFWQAQDRARQKAGRALDTVGDALERYERALALDGKEGANVRRVYRHLPDRLRRKSVAMLKAEDLSPWRSELAAMMQPASVNRTMTVLKAALNMVAEANHLDRHAWTYGLKRLKGTAPARNVILTDGQVLAIVDAARDEGIALALYIEILAVSGARPSQVRKLTVNDVIAGNAPHLRMPVSKKGRGEKRISHYRVPISGDFAARLLAYAAGRTGPLLLRPDGREWRLWDLTYPFTRIAERAGLDPTEATPYALRHSSIVRQILANVPLRVVAAGHDTSAAVIEENYSVHIADHADEIARAALLDTSPRTSETVIPLRRR